MKSLRPRSILITGASSGIGEALARHYAMAGTRLFLCGRDPQRIEAVAAACRARGAEADGAVVDVAERDATAGWVAASDRAEPLDLVIANAGISGDTSGVASEEARAREIFAVNLAGVANTVLPALEAMRRRKGGQIAVMASLAAYRGMPSAPAYSASKAAVKAWGEALRVVAADDGVRVSVVCPGFVESRITAANTFPMPLLMDAPAAARRIARGLAADRAVIAFPWPMVMAMWGLSVLPAALATRLLARLPRKE